MHDSDWLKVNLRLIFLICVQTQVLCNGAYILQIQNGGLFYIALEYSQL